VASGKLPWELPLPSHFESASEWADEDAIAEAIVHVYFHQAGLDQEGFLRFAERELLPALEDVR